MSGISACPGFVIDSTHVRRRASLTLSLPWGPPIMGAFSMSAKCLFVSVAASVLSSLPPLYPYDVLAVFYLALPHQYHTVFVQFSSKMPPANGSPSKPIQKKRYLCDCAMYCKYLKEIAERTYYAHRSVPGNTWTAASTVYEEDPSVPGGKSIWEKRNVETAARVTCTVLGAPYHPYHMRRQHTTPQRIDQHR